MVVIRPAVMTDETALVHLLAELDYPDTASFITSRLQTLLVHPDSELWIAEEEGNLCGFISLHFIPQIALEGDFCRISYLCVDSNFRGSGIGRLLLEQAEKSAAERKCDRIELHSHSRRVRAHEFYYRENYKDHPKYIIKQLR